MRSNYYKSQLTCALGGRHIGTGLIPEQQPALVRTGVDVALRTGAPSVASVVREGHGPVEGTGHRGRLLAEHREQQCVARDVGAQRGQAVARVAVRWKQKMRDGC